jgi:hypothetical protein
MAELAQLALLQVELDVGLEVLHAEMVQLALLEMELAGLELAEMVAVVGDCLETVLLVGVDLGYCPVVVLPHSPVEAPCKLDCGLRLRSLRMLNSTIRLAAHSR